MSGRFALYELLGLRPQASVEDIKKTYRKLAAKHHPEKADGVDNDSLKRIVNAYQILSDPIRKEEYDRLGDGFDDCSDSDDDLGELAIPAFMFAAAPFITPFHPFSIFAQASSDPLKAFTEWRDERRSDDKRTVMACLGSISDVEATLKGRIEALKGLLEMCARGSSVFIIESVLDDEDALPTIIEDIQNEEEDETIKFLSTELLHVITTTNYVDVYQAGGLPAILSVLKTENSKVLHSALLSLQHITQLGNACAECFKCNVVQYCLHLMSRHSIDVLLTASHILHNLVTDHQDTHAALAECRKLTAERYFGEVVRVVAELHDKLEPVGKHVNREKKKEARASNSLTLQSQKVLTSVLAILSQLEGNSIVLQDEDVLRLVDMLSYTNVRDIVVNACTVLQALTHAHRIHFDGHSEVAEQLVEQTLALSRLDPAPTAAVVLLTQLIHQRLLTSEDITKKDVGRLLVTHLKSRNEETSVAAARGITYLCSPSIVDGPDAHHAGGVTLHKSIAPFLESVIKQLLGVVQGTLEGTELRPASVTCAGLAAIAQHEVGRKALIKQPVFESLCSLMAKHGVDQKEKEAASLAILNISNVGKKIDPVSNQAHRDALRNLVTQLHSKNSRVQACVISAFLTLAREGVRLDCIYGKSLEQLKTTRANSKIAQELYTLLTSTLDTEESPPTSSSGSEELNPEAATRHAKGKGATSKRRSTLSKEKDANGAIPTPAPSSTGANIFSALSHKRRKNEKRADPPPPPPQPLLKPKRDRMRSEEEEKKRSAEEEFQTRQKERRKDRSGDTKEAKGTMKGGKERKEEAAAAPPPPPQASTGNSKTSPGNETKDDQGKKKRKQKAATSSTASGPTPTSRPETEAPNASRGTTAGKGGGREKASPSSTAVKAPAQPPPPLKSQKQPPPQPSKREPPAQKAGAAEKAKPEAANAAPKAASSAPSAPAPRPSAKPSAKAEPPSATPSPALSSGQKAESKGPAVPPAAARTTPQKPPLTSAAVKCDTSTPATRAPPPTARATRQTIPPPVTPPPSEEKGQATSPAPPLVSCDVGAPPATHPLHNIIPPPNPPSPPPGCPDDLSEVAQHLCSIIKPIASCPSSSSTSPTLPIDRSTLRDADDDGLGGINVAQLVEQLGYTSDRPARAPEAQTFRWPSDNTPSPPLRPSPAKAFGRSPSPSPASSPPRGVQDEEDRVGFNLSAFAALMKMQHENGWGNECNANYSSDTATTAATTAAAAAAVVSTSTPSTPRTTSDVDPLSFFALRDTHRDPVRGLEMPTQLTWEGTSNQSPILQDLFQHNILQPPPLQPAPPRGSQPPPLTPVTSQPPFVLSQDPRPHRSPPSPQNGGHSFLNGRDGESLPPMPELHHTFAGWGQGWGTPPPQQHSLPEPAKSTLRATAQPFVLPSRNAEPATPPSPSMVQVVNWHQLQLRQQQQQQQQQQAKGLVQHQPPPQQQPPPSSPQYIGNPGYQGSMVQQVVVSGNYYLGTLPPRSGPAVHRYPPQPMSQAQQSPQPQHHLRQHGQPPQQQPLPPTQQQQQQQQQQGNNGNPPRCHTMGAFPQGAVSLMPALGSSPAPGLTRLPP